MPAPPIVVDGSEWSNISAPMYAGYPSAGTYPPPPGDENPSGDESEPFITALTKSVEDIEEVVEAELVDEIVEQVALPPAQKLIPASAVVASDGVPYGRGGWSRSLNRIVPGSGGGSRRNPFGQYARLAGSVLGRNPTLTGDDPMPTTPPPTRG